MPCPSLAMYPSHVQADKAIEAVVDAFYEKLLVDPSVEKFFKGHDHDKRAPILLPAGRLLVGGTTTTVCCSTQRTAVPQRHPRQPLQPWTGWMPAWAPDGRVGTGWAGWVGWGWGWAWWMGSPRPRGRAPPDRALFRTAQGGC